MGIASAKISLFGRYSGVAETAEFVLIKENGKILRIFEIILLQ